MKTVHVYLVTLLFAALISPVAAQEDFTVKDQTIARSQYVCFDNGLVYYPKGVIQGNLSFEHDASGLFLDLWYSSGFNTDWSTDWDDELDYTLGWKGKVNDFSLTMSIAYFDNYSVGSLPYNDVVRGFIRLGLPTKEIGEISLTPFGSYAGYFIPDNETPFEGGNVFTLGIDSEVTLMSWLKVASSTSLGWDEGIFETKPGFTFKHSSTVNVQVSKHLTWNALEATIYVPLGNRNMKTEVVLGTGLLCSF